MKKLITTTIVILAIGIAMVVVGSVLKGVAWSSDFDGSQLAIALSNIGYIVAALSGIVLTGVGIVAAVKSTNSDDKQDKEKKD